MEEAIFTTACLILLNIALNLNMLYSQIQKIHYLLYKLSLGKFPPFESILSSTCYTKHYCITIHPCSFMSFSFFNFSYIFEILYFILYNFISSTLFYSSIPHIAYLSVFQIQVLFFHCSRHMYMYIYVHTYMYNFMCMYIYHYMYK